MRGGCDFTGLLQLKNQLENMEKNFSTWLEGFLLRQAQIVLANTKRDTPVDTGWLRESWYIGEIKRAGNKIEVSIINDAEYASFVEYGHMNRNRTDWIEGRFMCTLAIRDIQRKLPAKFEREFAAWVKSLGADTK